MSEPREEYQGLTEPGYRADIRLARPFWAVALIGGGIGLAGVLLYSPDVIPYGSLGPVGSFLHAMAYKYRLPCALYFWVSVLVHIGQGVYQWILCRRHKFTPLSTLFWVVQTTLFASPSLLRFKQCIKKTD